MKNSLTSAARLALAATLCALSITAQAQVIRISSTATANATSALAPVPPAYTCATPAAVTQSAFFDVQSSGAQFDKWKIEGDYTLISSLTANPLQFQPTGYGKVRITAQYYAISIGNGSVTCPPGPSCPYTYQIRTYATATAEYFKNVPNAQWVIKGPTCVPANNPSVVYSVDPALISTIPQIQSGVGIDDYKWVVTYTSGPSNGLAVPITYSGDHSAIILQGVEPLKTSVLTGSFTVQAFVGKCNIVAGVFQQIPVTVATPVASAITLNTLSCKSIGTTSNEGFTLATQIGVTYTLTTTGGLTLQSNGTGPFVSTITIPSTTPSGTTPIAVSNITLTGIGSVIVTAAANTGTCFGNQTVTLPLTRVLSATNTLSPNCLPAGTNAIALTSAPLGQDVQYALTGTGTGWSFNGPSLTNTGTVSVVTGSGAKSLTAVAAGCAGYTVTQPLTVRGTLGCTYVVERAFAGDDYTWRVVGTPPAGCSPCPTCTPVGAGTTYTWNAPGNTTVVNNNKVVSFLNPVTTGTVTVTIQNDASCLFAPASGSRPAPGGGGGSGDGVLDNLTPAAARAGVGLSVQLSAYPNPVAGVLTVDLRFLKGAARLVLLDNLGREVRQLPVAKERNSFDVRGLPAGLYSVRAELPEGQSLTQRVEVKP